MGTLIIGRRCSDGVVLAADRRELRGYEPTEQSKIRQLEVKVNEANAAVLVAGAGVAAFWDEVTWSLSQNMKSGAEPEPKTLLDVVDRISSISISLSGRYQRGSLDERLGCVMVGLEGLISGKAELYYFAGAGFSKTEFICLGSGETYALPMADLLLHQRILTTNKARQILPFLFVLVERVNISVGEGPDVFVLRDNEQVIQIPANQIQRVRTKASNFVKTLPNAFPNIVSNPDVLRQLPQK